MNSTKLATSQTVTQAHDGTSDPGVMKWQRNQNLGNVAASLLVSWSKCHISATPQLCPVIQLL